MGVGDEQDGKERQSVGTGIGLHGKSVDRPGHHHGSTRYRPSPNLPWLHAHPGACAIDLPPHLPSHWGRPAG